MNLPCIRLRRFVYRAHNPRWSFAPESGEGARLHGGRFNPPGVDALYTCLRPETAWLEGQQGFPFKPQPLTLCAYTVDCRDVVDLTSETTRTALGISVNDLACPWEAIADRKVQPPTWRLAEMLIAQGCAGLLAPSFAPGSNGDDINAVFWRWSPEPPHRLRIIDDEGRLPRTADAWQ